MIETLPVESLTMAGVDRKAIAKYLLEIQAVRINVQNPFTWVSGIKSPIYCDNRIINSKVKVRDAVVGEFSNIILDNFIENTDIIAGVATGGIPYGVLVADRLKLPFIYVREKRKEHGLMKRIEGEFKKGDRVVLIEDHISTGISSIKAIEALRDEEVEVICLISIMTYGFKEAEQAFKGQRVKHISICDLDTIIEVAKADNMITAQDAEIVLNFRDNHHS
jgi:orotate phosphoribosyltransferase